MKVLLFDSWFDRFRGVICLVEIMDGQIKKGDKIKSHHTQTEYEVQDLGILYPNEVATDTLYIYLNKHICNWQGLRDKWGML